MDFCTGCGRSVRGEWKHCLFCGTTLVRDEEPSETFKAGAVSPGGAALGNKVATAPNSSVGAARPAEGRPGLNRITQTDGFQADHKKEKGRWRRPWRQPKSRAKKLFTSRRVLILGMVVALVLLAAGVFADIDVRGKLRRTQAELNRTQEMLGNTRSSLADTQDELESTGLQLDQRTSERNALRSKLDRANLKLRGLRGSLADAETQLSLQSDQIEVLKSCLAGVSSALYYASYEDYALAVYELERVRSSCESAYSLF